MEVNERFAKLIGTYLREAVEKGEIEPLDLRSRVPRLDGSDLQYHYSLGLHR